MKYLIRIGLLLWASFGCTLAVEQYFPVTSSQLVPTEYEYVPKFFITDDVMGGIGYNASTERLGLDPDSSWEDVKETLQELNQNSDGSVYKLFFIGRHGHGWHNYASRSFLPYTYSCYYKTRMGNGEIEWGDAELTPTGIAQVQALSEAWQTEIENGAPIPSSFYTSPLRRCLQTYNYTWSAIRDSEQLDPPVAKEMAREIYGLDTSSKRLSRSYIEEYLPEIEFESGFTEEDELFTKYATEPLQHVRYRANLLLNDIFANDTNEVISLTSHSVFISALLTTIRHPLVNIEPGGMVPVIIKGSYFDTYEQPRLPRFINNFFCRILPI